MGHAPETGQPWEDGARFRPAPMRKLRHGERLRHSDAAIPICGSGAPGPAEPRRLGDRSVPVVAFGLAAGEAGGL